VVKAHYMALLACRISVHLRLFMPWLTVTFLSCCCRYTRILAPELRVFDDARVNWRAPGGGSSPGSSFDGSEIRMNSSGSSGYMYN
jgi:hypothetical protein